MSESSPDFIAAVGDAWRAAACLALDPCGLGAVLRSDPGETSSAWLEAVRHALPPSTPLRRVPAHIDEERLLGGTDLAATVREGRAVYVRGVLEQMAGGLIVLPMAERVSPQLAARLANALDRRAISVVRSGRVSELPVQFGVVAIDSGRGGTERCAATLRERLALHLDLTRLMLEGNPDLSLEQHAIEGARARLRAVASGEPALRTLCATAAACGIESLRAPALALRVARASAALEGRTETAEEDLEFAARVVLAPRATVIPAAPEQSDPTPEAQTMESQAAPASDVDTAQEPGEIQDRVLAAARAAIPAALLAELLGGSGVRQRVVSIGRAGASAISKRRGRPAGVRAGKPRDGSRFNLIATLRAAAPWQRVRRAAAGITGQRVLVRGSDFRVTWYRQHTQTVTVFALDASGSSALHRLAEAKGAIELLLAECYVRRDQVAVLSFRGRGAELVLAPTRSLLRAKRCLAGLPGGGGTPLAAGIDAARALAAQVARHGQTPSVVLLSDGAANIARDGSSGRARATEDALQAARALGGGGFSALMIDTAPRPAPQARALAQAMQARYLALPDANAQSLAAAVQHGD